MFEGRYLEKSCVRITETWISRVVKVDSVLPSVVTLSERTNVSVWGIHRVRRSRFLCHLKVFQHKHNIVSGSRNRLFMTTIAEGRLEPFYDKTPTTSEVSKSG